MKHLQLVYRFEYIFNTRILTHYRPAMPFGNRKIYLEDLFCSALPQFKKYHPSGNLESNNLCIFQSLKLRILVEKILPISLKLNFTPNTWVNDYIYLKALGEPFVKAMTGLS